jgi:predicted RNA binding protein YcfA (HicA-like mRNA interferase family)
MVRLAKKNGCELVRHGAKHDIWRNLSTGNEEQIPRHQSKELPTGTAERIKKGLGLK